MAGHGEDTTPDGDDAETRAIDWIARQFEDADTEPVVGEEPADDVDAGEPTVPIDAADLPAPSRAARRAAPRPFGAAGADAPPQATPGLVPGFTVPSPGTPGPAAPSTDGESGRLHPGVAFVLPGDSGEDSSGEAPAGSAPEAPAASPSESPGSSEPAAHSDVPGNEEAPTTVQPVVPSAAHAAAADETPTTVQPVVPGAAHAAAADETPTTVQPAVPGAAHTAAADETPTTVQPAVTEPEFPSPTAPVDADETPADARPNAGIAPPADEGSADSPAPAEDAPTTAQPFVAHDEDDDASAVDDADPGVASAWSAIPAAGASAAAGVPSAAPRAWSAIADPAEPVLPAAAAEPVAHVETPALGEDAATEPNADAPTEPDADTRDSAGGAHSDSASDEPRSTADAAAEELSVFPWALVPGDEPDPVVAPADEPEAAPAAPPFVPPVAAAAVAFEGELVDEAPVPPASAPETIAVDAIDDDAAEAPAEPSLLADADADANADGADAAAADVDVATDTDDAAPDAGLIADEQPGEAGPETGTEPETLDAGIVPEQENVPAPAADPDAHAERPQGGDGIFDAELADDHSPTGVTPRAAEDAARAAAAAAAASFGAAAAGGSLLGAPAANANADADAPLSAAQQDAADANPVAEQDAAAEPSIDTPELDIDPIRDSAVFGEALVPGSGPVSAGATPIAGAVPSVMPRSDGGAGEPRVAPPRRGAPGPRRSSGTGGPRRFGTGAKVAAGVVTVLVLAGLFAVGTLIPGLLGGDTAPAARPTPSASADPTPVPAPAPTAPAAAGEHAWTELYGGECLTGFEGAWANTYTVVDCAEPHDAQLVRRAPVAEGDDAAFPGEPELASRIGILCGAPGVVDPDLIGELTDLQVQGSYPVSAEQWDAGQREYSCFVSRSSGEAITGSLATEG